MQLKDPIDTKLA